MPSGSATEWAGSASRSVAPTRWPIIPFPVMIGDASPRGAAFGPLRWHYGTMEAADHGIYVIGFSFPVVPKGQARIRTQMSGRAQ
jgi:glycine C-acetyltransferase